MPKKDAIAELGTRTAGARQVLGRDEMRTRRPSANEQFEFSESSLGFESRLPSKVKVFFG